MASQFKIYFSGGAAFELSMMLDLSLKKFKFFCVCFNTLIFWEMIIFIFILFCLISSIEDSSDLPYDDPSDQQIPTAKPSLPYRKPRNNEPDSMVPLFIVLGVIAFLFIISIISYQIGKFDIQNSMTYFQQTLNSYLEKSLHLEKINFMQYGVHEFEVFFKSKNPNIYGCIVHVSMGLSIDIFHRIKYWFTKRVDKVTFEYLLHPSKRFSAMIHISKEIPFFAKDFKLSKQEISCGYSSFSDVQGYDKNLVNTISNFIEKHPNLVRIIELSDANRFKAKEKFGYVTRVEFNVTNFKEDINFSTLRFGYELADSFTKVKIPENITEDNKIKRTKLVERAKAQMERMRRFQEAQRIFHETGQFPDLPDQNNPYQSTETNNEGNKDEQTEINNDENSNGEKLENNERIKIEKKEDVKIDSSGNIHEKTD